MGARQGQKPCFKPVFKLNMGSLTQGLAGPVICTTIYISSRTIELKIGFSEDSILESIIIFVALRLKYCHECFRTALMQNVPISGYSHGQGERCILISA